MSLSNINEGNACQTCLNSNAKQYFYQPESMILQGLTGGNWQK